MNTQTNNQTKALQTMSRILNQIISSKNWSTDLGILLLRICCAFMAIHGWSKLTDFYDGIAEWPDPFYVGPVASKGLTIFAELICTILLVLGLFTRTALIPLIICMLVIVFVVHAEDTIPDREHPIMYLIMYLSLFVTGPGKYSIDKLMSNK
jgi:putative oxidoreductase